MCTGRPSRRTATLRATPDRTAALDADIARVGDGFLENSDTMEWEYLLLTARKG